MRTLLRVLTGIVVAVLVIWLLFTKVFPWVDRALVDPTLSVLIASR